MKEEIRFHAIRLFDQKGFHGTSVRDISDAAGCKMPTVYHHFGNKNKLFDEVVRVAYMRLLGELQDQLPKKLMPQDYCAKTIIKMKGLPENDLIVCRLAMKTWLGCEGCDEVRQKLIDWESARNEKNEELLMGVVSSRIWVKIITRTFMNLLERVILFNENISNKEICEEMGLVFEAAKRKERG